MLRSPTREYPPLEMIDIRRININPDKRKSKGALLPLWRDIIVPSTSFSQFS